MAELSLRKTATKLLKNVLSFYKVVADVHWVEKQVYVLQILRKFLPT